MDNLQKRQAGHEGRLPGGFAFSLREEDACRAVTPSVLEGLLGRFLTDARRSGTVYTPGFLVRWMAREAVSSWLESRLPSPRSGDEEAGLLGSIRVLDLSVGAGAFTMGMLPGACRPQKASGTGLPGARFNPRRFGREYLRSGCLRGGIGGGPFPFSLRMVGRRRKGGFTGSPVVRGQSGYVCVRRLASGSFNGDGGRRL